MKPITYDLGRGILTVGKPELTGYGITRRWIREDEFRFKPESGSPWYENGRAHRDHTFCAGPQDYSNRQRKGFYYEGSDERCSCCWLSICHTEDCHRQNIENHESSLQKGVQA